MCGMTAAISIPREPLRPRSMEALVAEGVALSVYYGMTITPADVVRVLNAAGVVYVLAGAHAINAYTGRPRATRDVDILTNSPKKAADALAAAFPQLEVRDTPVVTRLLLDGDEAIDVMKAGTSKLFRRVVRTSHQVDFDGEVGIVPSVEGVLAMKFSSMISVGRQHEDRLVDASDFIKVVKAADRLNVPVDLDRLREFGDLVYDNGGNEIVRHAEDVRAGRPLSI